MAWPITHIYIAGQVQDEFFGGYLDEIRYFFSAYDYNWYFWGAIAADFNRFSDGLMKREETHMLGKNNRCDLFTYDGKIEEEDNANQQRIMNQQVFDYGYRTHLLVDDYLEKNVLLQSDGAKFALDRYIRKKYKANIRKYRWLFLPGTTIDKFSWAQMAHKIEMASGEEILIEHLINKRYIQKEKAEEMFGAFKKEMSRYISNPSIQTGSYNVDQNKIEAFAKEYIKSGKIAKAVINKFIGWDKKKD
ncbi:hypothetical protein ACFLQI_03590 [Candidatus Undinarchaeota archaeon]